jgi:hypothetical protein
MASSELEQLFLKGFFLPSFHSSALWCRRMVKRSWGRRRGTERIAFGQTPFVVCVMMTVGKWRHSAAQKEKTTKRRGDSKERARKWWWWDDDDWRGEMSGLLKAEEWEGRREKWKVNWQLGSWVEMRRNYAGDIWWVNWELDFIYKENSFLKGRSSLKIVYLIRHNSLNPVPH